jgi:hypothetical protein
MPTQFSRLLRPPGPGQADPLVEKLKRRDPDAEREIARRYNRKIPRKKADRGRTIPESPKGGSYDTYDPRLLAILWALAGNADALHAFGRRLGLAVSPSPTYAALSDDLLARLWELARDGSALEQLWLRQGLLPAAVCPETPEYVLGFLCWQQQAGAWDELFRRYALLDIQRSADDDEGYPAAAARLLERFRLGRVPRPCQTAREFAAVAAAKLLALVPLWDYVAYESVEHMLVKASHNELRDMRRAGRRRSTVSADELPEVADLRRTLPGAAELQDALAHLPVEERVVRKAQNGLDLTDDEQDWAARRNLQAGGIAVPSDEELAVERNIIVQWLADNRSPTGTHLSKVFPWYKPTQFGKSSRVARLRLLIDEADRYLDQLAADAPPEARALRRQVRRAMDDLLQRTASGNRPSAKDRPRPGPVVCFEKLDEAARRLLHLLGSRPLDRRQADAFARLLATFSLFGDQFPVLVKLAACRRLIRVVPGTGDLAAWLDGGQQWLSSLHEKDRERCRDFAESLAALESAAVRQGGALQMLLAWLQSTQQPGPAEARLGHADRAWWLSRGREDLTEAADTLAEFARASKWPAAAEAADLMLQRLGPAPATCWSAECELRACLERLRAGRRDLPARLEACRRLLADLRDHGGVTPRRLADWSLRLEGLEAEGEDGALYREVSVAADAPAAPPALGLLALWLQPAGESPFSERALKDLTLLWALTHDPWYTWPAEVPAEVAGLIAAAREGDWPRLADAATRMMRRGPDLSGVSRSDGDDFCAALQRLARRRGQRHRARRTST